MKHIPVGKDGLFAVVDEADYEELAKYKWDLTGHRYAARQWQKDRIKNYSYMHREIMNPPAGMIVDHINGDPLDNRRSNLRICTLADNAHNSKTPKNNTSGFKGVYFYKARGKYTARIMAARKSYNLGYFNTALEASAAYQAAAKIYHGEFARQTAPA